MWAEVRDAERFYALSRDRREPLRVARLQELLQYAYDEVPHYRRKFDSVGLKPADIRSFDDLTQIPITTKDELKAGFPDAVLGRAYRDDPRLRSARSGATSGQPVPVRVDFDAVVRKYAEITHQERRNGWHVGDRTAHALPCPYMSFYMKGLLKTGSFTEGLSYLWSMRHRELDRDLVWFLEYYLVYPILHRRLLMGPVHSLNGEIDSLLIADQLEQLCRYRSKKSRVYPLYAWLWAHHVRDMGALPAPLGDIALVGGLSTPRMSRFIQDQLGSDLYDFYGSAEGGGLAAECSQRDGLHIYDRAAHIELLRQGKPAPDHTRGCLVFTDLNNRAMPFIRYWTGDIAEWEEPGRCPCGLDTRKLRLKGRCISTLIGPHGEELVEEEVVDHILERADLYLFQVLMEEKHKVVLRVIEGRQERVELSRATDALRELFGPGCKIGVEERDRLAPQRRGKYTFTGSRFEQDLSTLMGDFRPRSTGAVGTRR
jgi:phenylacetate-CoA ligase